MGSKNKIQKTGTEGKGNTKRPSGARNWAMTWNNYDEDELMALVEKLKDLECKFILGREVGKENETPHIQGHIELSRKQRFTYLKNLCEKAHWEKAIDKKSSIRYCKKEDNYISNYDPSFLTELGVYTPKISTQIANMSEEEVETFWREFRLKLLKKVLKNK